MKLKEPSPQKVSGAEKQVVEEGEDSESIDENVAGGGESDSIRLFQ